MFIVVLLITVVSWWKNIHNFSTTEQIRKLPFISTINYCSVIKNNIFVQIMMWIISKTLCHLKEKYKKQTNKKKNSMCIKLEFSVFSVTQSCPTLCDPMDCSTLGFPVHHQLSELAQTHVHQVVMTSNHLILCHPLLLHSIFPRVRVFSSESVLCIM